MIYNLKKGFTLIELLIVMAILGVIAVVVLVAINPTQQLAKTRDTGRKSSVTQLGRSLQSYFTSRGRYLTATNCTSFGTNWIDCLVTTGIVKTVPPEVVYRFPPNCEGGTVTPGDYAAYNRWCYRASTTGDLAIVYAKLESSFENRKCPSPQTAYYVWSSADGRSCRVCIDNVAVPNARPGYGPQPNCGS